MSTRKQKQPKQATTIQNRFCAFAGDTKEQPMFSVNPGVPVDSALETSPCLLDTLSRLLTVAADGKGLSSDESVAVLIMITQAKAALDAAWEGIERQDDAVAVAQVSSLQMVG